MTSLFSLHYIFDWNCLMKKPTFNLQGPNMFQLMDLFAVPEMTLFSNVIQVKSEILCCI